MRDPYDVARLANDLLRLRLEPRRDAQSMIALAWAVSDPARLRKNLMKSCGYVARYLRQPMEWVEGLSLFDLNQWVEVASEILTEEQGGAADKEKRDPFGFNRGDD